MTNKDNGLIKVSAIKRLNLLTDKTGSYANKNLF